MDKRRFIPLVAIGALAVGLSGLGIFRQVIAGEEGTVEVTLRIEGPRDAVEAGKQAGIKVILENVGKRPVTLVSPGDGSDCRWRTPVVAWSVIAADDDRARHPEEAPIARGPRCGNINPIRLNELFTLRPGESRELNGWVSAPSFSRPGKYRVVFYYENLPELKVTGVPLGTHEPGALEKIRDSHSCRLVSNELVVEVLPAH